jgi:drug/metabolite transporter (DMT)-like permease
MSLTYLGLIVSMLGYLAQFLGIRVGPEQITTTVETIVIFVGALIAFYGRFRKGDVKWYGTKK